MTEPGFSYDPGDDDSQGRKNEAVGLTALLVVLAALTIVCATIVACVYLIFG